MKQAFPLNENVVIIAGPGTGKTTKLLEIINSNINDSGLNPSDALVLMFNSDIKNEFANRMQSSNLHNLTLVKTFHAMALKILKESGYLKALGMTVSFDDGSIQKKMCSSVISQLSVLEFDYKKKQMMQDKKAIGLIMQFISLVKSTNSSPEDVYKTLDLSPTCSFIVPSYYAFEKIRCSKGLIFYDDFVPYATTALNKPELVINPYSEVYTRIFVDEYQDINQSQYNFINAIKSDSTTIVVAGDIDQTIYSWRGSDPTFMLNFESTFTPVQRVILNKTHRFGHSIALVTNKLISNNNQRFNKIVSSSTTTPNSSVRLIETMQPAGEAIKIISANVLVGESYGDHAILLRRWSESILYELSFLLKKIPYSIPPNFSLLNSKEIRLLSYILILITNQDEVLLQDERKNILIELLGFPSLNVTKAVYDDVITRLSNLPFKLWPSAIDTICMSSKDTGYKKVSERIRNIASLKMISSKNAYEVLKKYLDDSQVKRAMNFTSISSDEYEESLERIDTLLLILEKLQLSCKSALEYFNTLFKMTAIYNQSGGVTLTTIYRSKGREFKNVILPNWDKDLLGSNNSSLAIPISLEESRRLAYVATTRASSNLIMLTRPQKQNCSKKVLFARFLDEMKIESSNECAKLINLNQMATSNLDEIEFRYVQSMTI